jgi:hypothetical protein
VGNLKGIFRTYCFCQASEKRELIVQAPLPHPRKLAKVLVKGQSLFYLTDVQKTGSELDIKWVL